MWRRTAGEALVMTVPLAGILLVQVSVAIYLLRGLYPVSYYDSAGQEQTLRLHLYGPSWHSLDRAFEWVRQHATAGAVVATTVPHLAYLRTRHKAVLPPLERDTATAGRLLDEVPVSVLNPRRTWNSAHQHRLRRADYRTATRKLETGLRRAGWWNRGL